MCKEIKAVGFDVGHTLIKYNNPLNWQALYRPALENVAQVCGITLSEEMLRDAMEILLKYNTRVNHREYEVTSNLIFGEILEKWSLALDIETVKEGFYNFFKANACPYPEAIETLAWLRQAGLKTGVLTDVAYGMDNRFSLQEIVALSDYLDIVLTSVDVGYRKPSNVGFLKLLEHFQVQPGEMMYVGDEEKDILGAARLGIVSVLINRSGTPKEFHQDYTINSLSEILNIVGSFEVG